MSTPATSTFEHSGQDNFSSFHFRRVAGWSTRTRASHSVHWSSPKPEGRSPVHLGQESGGGATLDSTLSSSTMESLLLGVENELLGDEVPRYVEGQSKFLGKANNQLFGANLVAGTFQVKHDDLSSLFIDR